MKKKICFLSDHHICYNPRLWKEAFFYEGKGYEVVIYVMWTSERALELDLNLLKGHSIKYLCYCNLIKGQSAAWFIFFHRIRKRVCVELQKHFGIGLPWAISYSPERMLSSALHENADFYSAHLECAFYAGRKLIKKGKKVFFDFEDWYSRDYLVPGRPVKLLYKLEDYALENALFCTAASRSMAESLKKSYNSNKTIEVIYNGFSTLENRDAKRKQTGLEEGEVLRIIWFSRTIGAGRGLEKFIKVLSEYNQPVELTLLGMMSEGFKKELINIFPYDKGHALHFHGFIPHKEITKFISSFSIGLAIEEKESDSRNVTITNKILQYLQSGLKVLATNTEGQKEVASYFKNGVKLIDLENPSTWANALKELAKGQGEENYTQLFNTHFSWEAQEFKLNKLAEKYL